MKTNKEILEEFYKLGNQKKMMNVVKKALHSSNNSDEIVKKILEILEDSFAVAYRLGVLEGKININDKGEIEYV